MQFERQGSLYLPKRQPVRRHAPQDWNRYERYRKRHRHELAFGDYVQGANNLETSGTVSTLDIVFSGNVAAGNSILVTMFAKDSDTAVLSVVDTRGNSYQQDEAAHDGPSLYDASIWRAHNIKGGPCTVTVTMNNNAAMRCSVHEYSGDFLLDQKNKSTGTGVDLSSGNITTTKEVSIIVGVGFTFDFTTTWTPGASFNGPRQPLSRGAVEDRQVFSTGTYNATFTVDTSSLWAMIVLNYYAGAVSIGHTLNYHR